MAVHRLRLELYLPLEYVSTLDSALQVQLTFQLKGLSKNSEALGFDVYNVPEQLDPNPLGDGTVFLNDPRTRTALHAPISKDWAMEFTGVFDGDPNGGCSRLSIVPCCYGLAD
jgi:hypothetical protein